MGRIEADPHGAPEIGPGPVAGPASGTSGWLGRNGARWARAATGPTPGPPPPWGMQNVLCRLRWLTSPPNQPGAGHADQGVQVGAVHVDLAAVVVDEVADLGDALLEHAVGGRVGHHQCGEVGAVLDDLGLEVGHVDVAVVIAGHHDHAHAGHDGRGGVGAVGRRRDQADVAGGLAPVGVVATDREQAGQLALGAGVGLERHGVVAGDLGQPALEALDQLAVAAGLVERGERVQGAELGPGDGRHLGGGVELHRAAAEGDHRPVEGHVLVRQRPEVAEHLGLGAMRREDRVGQVLRRARRGGPGRRAGSGRWSPSTPRRPPPPARSRRRWWSRRGPPRSCGRRACAGSGRGEGPRR